MIDNSIMMRELRIRWNIRLVRLGFRKVLPREAIARVNVKECHEHLVVVPPELNASDCPQKIRRGLLLRLAHANRLLPKGYEIRVYEGFRSFQRQQELWDHEVSIAKIQFPDADLKEIERMVRLQRIAKPDGDGSGHQTGGAVDILLFYEGVPVDMGTAIHEFTERTPTCAKCCSTEERHNRGILFRAMKKAGFINFPTEWWHYSYGDRMWAAYSWKKCAMYGAIMCK